MNKGFIGKVVKVDLSSKRIEIEGIEEKIYRKYLGGSALASYFLLKELKPGTDPFSEDNILVFTTSILSGTTIPGAIRYTVASKSPLTGAFGEAEAGGYWAPQLKKAGFDAIVIKGCADKLSYIWIHNGKVELRDATHLKGKTTGEAESIIRRELNDSKICIAQIGPAGENLVRYACILNNVKHANGRTGLGAVMGSKNLRAIAVRGTQEVSVVDKEKIKNITKWFAENWKDTSLGMHENGTANGLMDLNIRGILPTRNFKDGEFEGAEKISGEATTKNILIKREGCYACPIRCKRIVECKDKYKVDPYYGGPEYETVGAFGALCGIDNLEAIAKANELCNKYGMDTISTGVTIAFAMECYENGLLSNKDTEGIELKFGSAEAMLQMIEKIKNRQGIGDLLAEGTLKAATKIGPKSKKYAMQVKGQELPLHEPRGKTGLGLAYALASTGAEHMEAPHDTDFEIEENNKNIDDLSLIGINEAIDPLDLSDKKVKFFNRGQKLFSLYNSIGICDFCAVPIGPLTLEKLVESVKAITGWRTSLYELMKVAERTDTMSRCFNIREGLSRKDDILPERLFEPLGNGPLKGKFIDRDKFEKAINTYYKLEGWDSEGKPTESRLLQLDLEWIKL